MLLIPITSIWQLLRVLFADAFPVIAIILVVILYLLNRKREKADKKAQEKKQEEELIKYAKAVPEESNRPGEEKPPFDEYVMDGWGTPHVVEKVRVYPDYIQYNTRCKDMRIHYLKFAYRVEWDKLFVKAFEFAFIDYDWPEKESDKYYILKDWNLNQEEIDRYTEWCVDVYKRYLRERARPRREYTEADKEDVMKRVNNELRRAKTYGDEWHEFKYMSAGDRYWTRAKEWILNYYSGK